AGHHHHVLPEAAALADDGAGHDVAKVPDLRILADPGAGVDVARLVDEIVRHLADHLDLELELDAGFLGDGLAHVVDDFEHFARGSSINASLASSTTTAPRLEERYLNEICLRGICLIFPLASMTVASVSTSANSAPCAPAFMYTPPPTVPGMPMKRSTPANPASAVRRASNGVASPAPTIAVAPFISKRSRPFPMRITT